MPEDEIMRDVRAIREAYAERFNYDIDALVRDAKQRQSRSKRKIVSLAPKRIAPSDA
ncbi:MAG TPA: hypothetical protein VLV83_21340 [Acidobacteriota bacterium]|nr:hypothetical protein [Acidobacteriota bacterium]